MDVAQRSVSSGERSVIGWCLCVIATGAAAAFAVAGSTGTRRLTRRAWPHVRANACAFSVTRSPGLPTLPATASASDRYSAHAAGLAPPPGRDEVDQSDPGRPSATELPDREDSTFAAQRHPAQPFPLFQWQAGHHEVVGVLDHVAQQLIGHRAIEHDGVPVPLVQVIATGDRRVARAQLDGQARIALETYPQRNAVEPTQREDLVDDLEDAVRLIEWELLACTSEGQADRLEFLGTHAAHASWFEPVAGSLVCRKSMGP